MKRSAIRVGVLALVGAFALAAAGPAQPPGGFPGGPGGFGPPGGFGGPPGGQTRKVLKEYDKNNDGWLNADERKPARDAAKKDARGRRPGGFGPPPGFGGDRGPDPKPGPKVSPADVPNYPDAPLYDPGVLRTVFLQFENPDWEAELEDFHGTDVDVPATLTVDGKTYRTVGVHFRGMSSYMMVRAGQKRSLNVALDLADPKQRLYGAKTLNLLNAHEDPSFLSTVLYSHLARRHIPAPKANLVKVVINGECWGVYASAQQFDKEFLKENFKTTKGTRWKVSGSPGGGGGLDYVGDKVEDYKRRYEIKSADDDESWKALIKLCKTLSQTPAAELEKALPPLMDVEGLLWFLALDVALINNDGYWVRASDYCLYRDEKGKFHAVPHDMNEAFHPGGPPGGFAFRMPRPGEVLPAFLQDQLKLTDAQKKQLAAIQKEVDGKLDGLLTPEQRKQLTDMRDRGPGGFGGPPGGPGGPGGPVVRTFGGPPGGGGLELDPLVGLDDPRKPLRSKVLAVPAWRKKYLQHVRTIAEELDWRKFGPVVAQYRRLVEKEIAADTRKLSSTEAFQRATADEPGEARGRETSLRTFADRRRKYLLDHPEVKKATP